MFDFGAGALDVSLIQITGRTFTVIGSSGDSHLGGDDITEILVEEAARSFQETFGKDVRSSASELQKLREAVEEGKKALSSVESYDVDEQLLEEDFHYRMTREGLERSARPLLERCLAKVEEVLGLMSNATLCSRTCCWWAAAATSPSCAAASPTASARSAWC